MDDKKFDNPSEEQMNMVDELAQSEPEAPQEETVSLATPEALKDAKPGDQVKIDAEVVDNADGQMTVKIISAS